MVFHRDQYYDHYCYNLIIGINDLLLQKANGKEVFIYAVHTLLLTSGKIRLEIFLNAQHCMDGLANGPNTTSLSIYA